MKKILIIALLALSLFLSSCDLFQSLKEEIFDMEPNDINDLIDEYITDTVEDKE